jgi:hypothetical protein
VAAVPVPSGSVPAGKQAKKAPVKRKRKSEKSPVPSTGVAAAPNPPAKPDEAKPATHKKAKKAAA